jgi:cyclopropane fatty-acyl-phospholipid synthase-like methyltransferase
MDTSDYFDTPPELLPYLPDLLADIWALGSSPEIVVEWLGSLRLPPETTRVLDLGCGKGAVSVTLARELGFRSLGIDFFEPFLIEARERARELGVDERCSFKYADMLDIVEESRNYDVVVYTGVGGVLGSFDKCVFRLRQTVRVGGYMVIDDGFRMTPKEIDRPGYDHYALYQETIRQLASHGDIILRENIVPVEDIKSRHQRETGLIAERVEGLSREHPEMANYFNEYLEHEKQECEIFERDIAEAMWLLEKS